MNSIPGHTLPSYSADSREDALFHYTTVEGLLGIMQSGEVWNTAYYCANDESELSSGRGFLTPLFRKKSHDLINESDGLLDTFIKRRTDIRDFAERFEQHISALALSLLCTYITCFCKPSCEEDFHHGLLSQWRGYGRDGGYALQFSRKKLLRAIEDSNESAKFNYELQDVHYDANNPLKKEVIAYKEAFIKAYMEYLNEISQPLSKLLKQEILLNPIPHLLGGPLEAFLDYLVHTKNKHFKEERECRLSIIQLVEPCDECMPINYFNRNGLLVPYTKTPKSRFNILDCVEWIVIGPGPRLPSRMKAVSQLVKQSRLDIKVRPSHIPYTRL